MRSLSITTLKVAMEMRMLTCSIQTGKRLLTSIPEEKDHEGIVYHIAISYFVLCQYRKFLSVGSLK